MPEKHFLSLLMINCGWNEKIHLFGSVQCAKEERGKEVGSNMYFCPRETGFENDRKWRMDSISTVRYDIS